MKIDRFSIPTEFPRFNRWRWLFASAAVVVFAVGPTPQVQAAGKVEPRFVEDFQHDPFAPSGRFSMVGPGTDAFRWNENSPPAFPGDKRGSLTVVIDSSRPTARIEAPLVPRPPRSSRSTSSLPSRGAITGAESFRIAATFSIDSLDAPPDEFFQIPFGLLNQAMTGLNRTGTFPTFGNADTYDMVEFSYFANISPFFGGPFLTPTVFGSKPPFGDAFFNFAALFGPPADLGDNVPPQITSLPLGVPLRATLDYDAGTQLLTLTLDDVSGKKPGRLETGLVPLDVSFVNATGTFDVDAIALMNWHDFADSDPSSPSLRAQVTFEELSFELLGASGRFHRFGSQCIESGDSAGDLTVVATPDDGAFARRGATEVLAPAARSFWSRRGGRL